MKNLENEKNIKNINDDGVLSQFKIFHNSLSSPMKFLIYGGSGILILCFLIGIAIEDENEQDIQESSENVQIKREYQGIKIFDTKIDMYKFAQVKTGMTVDQVNSIAKKKGNLFGESEAFGKNVQMYSWENKDGSNMTLTFENGRVISKAQIGLQ